MVITAVLIVKNEAQVIARCLRSLIDKVDFICICDTGSTDDTLEVIADTLRLTQHAAWQVPWHNDYSQARNANMARALTLFPDTDLFLHIDADEELIGELPVDEALQRTGHRIQVKMPQGNTFPRAFLSPPAARFTGRFHELLELPLSPILSNCYLMSHADGARAKDPSTQANDLKLIEDLLAENPKDIRLMVQMGQAYEANCLFKDAEFHYNEAIGPSHHGRYAAYRKAVTQHIQGKDYMPALLAAVDMGHSAAVLCLAHLWNDLELHHLALTILGSISQDPEELMGAQTWQIIDEESVAWAGVGSLFNAKMRCMALLKRKDVPPEELPRIQGNLDKLLELQNAKI